MENAFERVNGQIKEVAPQNSKKRWCIRQLVYSEVLEALDGIFTSLSVEYLPIKGAYLICSGLALKIVSREMIDLDLLVRETDYKQTVKLLSEHPRITCEPPDPWPFEQSFIFHHGNHPIRFELHYALNRSERFTLDTEEVFARSVKQTNSRRLMCIEDALTILICHTLVHLIDGITQQVFDEIRVLVSEPSFSWERFTAQFSETGIKRFGIALLRLYGEQGMVIPHYINGSGLSMGLLKIKSPGRKKNVLSLLFRAIVELYFVRNPAGLLITYLKGFGTKRLMHCIY